MTLQEEVKYRGIRVMFDRHLLTEFDTYKGVELIVFITERDAVRTKGFRVDKTLFFVDQFYYECKDSFNVVHSFFLDNNIPADSIKSNLRIRINKEKK